MTFKAPHVPVQSHEDGTYNWEQLQGYLEESITESQLSAAVQAKLNPGAWTNPEGFNAKLEETATCQVRLEQGATSVRIKGSVKAKEEIVAGSTLFTLPVGFRPPAVVHVPAIDITAGPNVLQEVFIQTTGVVEPSLKLTVAHVVAFDAITFHLT